MLKKILQRILYYLAKAILNKYQPEIIGITGSVGKTSTKEAVYSVLAAKFSVRKNSKNYNNEIGLPLTIIGAEAGGKSVWRWLEVFLKAARIIIIKDKNYPKILLLEMGIDRPGDMKYLTSLAPCHIGVVTNISAVHLEFFKSLEKIAKEKSVIVSHLKKNDWAVLNADNELVYQMKELAAGRVLTYGLNDRAQVLAREINVSSDGEKVQGLSFKLTYQGSTVPVLIPDILGDHLVYGILAGAAVGLIYGLNLLEISQAIRNFRPPLGRMHLVSGIKNTLIIDDTYNAGPQSTLAALHTLGELVVKGQKYAVLGDMLELGDYTEAAHQEVGQSVAENKIDYLITVGERANFIKDAAEEAGLPQDSIFHFSNSSEAGRFIQERISAGDIILIKGSQGMRMEKAVKEIMAEPLRAKELLVRQEESWLRK